MADQTEPRDYNKRAADWALMHLAASSSNSQETVRSYDWRYHRPDLTHERVRAEARLAAALAREYTEVQTFTTLDPASAPDQPDRTVD